MNFSPNIECPVCSGKSFVAKYEATYVYSYIIDSDAPGIKNHDEFLPFLFDNREQKGTREYIECTICGTQYPCSFKETHKGIDFTIMRKAVRADHTVKPEFFG